MAAFEDLPPLSQEQQEQQDLLYAEDYRQMTKDQLKNKIDTFFDHIGNGTINLDTVELNKLNEINDMLFIIDRYLIIDDEYTFDKDLLIRIFRFIRSEFQVTNLPRTAFFQILMKQRILEKFTKMLNVGDSFVHALNYTENGVTVILDSNGNEINQLKLYKITKVPDDSLPLHNIEILVEEGGRKSIKRLRKKTRRTIRGKKARKSRRARK